MRRWGASGEGSEGGDGEMEGRETRGRTLSLRFHKKHAERSGTRRRRQASCGWAWGHANGPCLEENGSDDIEREGNQPRPRPDGQESDEGQLRRDAEILEGLGAVQEDVTDVVEDHDDDPDAEVVVKEAEGEESEGDSMMGNEEGKVREAMVPEEERREGVQVVPRLCGVGEPEAPGSVGSAGNALAVAPELRGRGGGSGRASKGWRERGG